MKDSELITRKNIELALLNKGQNSRRYRLGDIWELNYDEIREVLDDVDADIQPVQWIPCSERLPKTHGNYYVTEKRFSVDDKNRTGKFTLETAYAYYSNHWQRAKFLEVVAWMPAEPYQDKRKGADV